jgi:hypothetical protein
MGDLTTMEMEKYPSAQRITCDNIVTVANLLRLTII